ncbi:hypothetical protein BHM03_00009513 [Ensete ventricosum]|nr:hypothetical protein BHM03_00009513 [Ensete ventricosum]
MGGTVSHHLSCSRRDLHSIDNGREDTPSDLACVELEKVLCLNDRLKVQSLNAIQITEIQKVVLLMNDKTKDSRLIDTKGGFDARHIRHDDIQDMTRSAISLRENYHRRAG